MESVNLLSDFESLEFSVGQLTRMLDDISGYVDGVVVSVQEFFHGYSILQN
jgi:hypothetical protein